MDDRLETALNKIQKTSVRIQNSTKNRYYDSPKEIQWEIVKVNDEGLFKLLGHYLEMRAFRYLYRLEDPAENRQKIEDYKYDILNEFLVKLNEEVHEC